MSKERLSGEDEASRQTAQQVLVHVLEGTLRLLHPMMPFITEELWQKLPHEGDSIMVAPWPQPDPAGRDAEAEAEMELLRGTVRALRNICADADVKAGREIEVVAQTDAEDRRALLEANAAYVRRLLSYTPRVKLKSFQVTGRDADKPRQALSAGMGDVDLYVPLRGVIDLRQEIERLEKELEKLAQELARTDQKLVDRDFVSKAPALVVNREREKRRSLFDRKERLTDRLRMLSEVAAEP
jgi:valyl-tRNA synthetase